MKAPIVFNLFAFWFFLALFLLAIVLLDFSVQPNYLLSHVGQQGAGSEDYLKAINKNVLGFFYISALIGLCFFLSIVAFVQGLFLGENTYILWAIYLFVNCLFLFVGLDYNFDLNLTTAAFHASAFNQNRPWAIPFQYLVAVSYLSFLSSFLNVKYLDYKLYIFIEKIQIGLIGLISLCLWDVYHYDFTEYIDTFIFVVLMSLCWIFYRVYKLRANHKTLFLIGSLGMVLFGFMAGIIDYFKTSDVQNFFLVPYHIFSFGMLFELLFFSMAISQRTLKSEKDKQLLQKKYTVQLENEIKTAIDKITTQSKEIEEQKILKLTTEFEQKIAETEVNALRSQMNPHFIFNCLNSIKLYSLENDSKSASEYLTKFSKLIRLVLDNSRSERLTLEKEIETLRLYIELEIMRFKEKVQYELKISPDIDQQYIEIPPLLVQPFVENAIWHGLMHKELGGKVSISIDLIEESILKIVIIDNGVGRTKAAEFKSKTATKHKSFGMKVTNERINLINQIYKTNASVEIVDLFDDKNNSTGTSVIIQIPI